MPLFSISQGKSSSGTENPKIEVAAYMESRNFLIRGIDYTAFNAQPQFKSISHASSETCTGRPLL